MSIISDLWQQGELPVKSGLYFADGRSLSAEIITYGEKKFSLQDFFDLEEFMRDEADWITSVDITRQEALENGCFFCFGEGSHGSEGFFAYLDENKNPVWIWYFDNSNPFDAFSIQDKNITITSTSYIEFQLSFENPQNIVATFN